MKLKYKYIYFVKSRKQNPKTMIYLVRTNNSHGLGILLGMIKWYAQWRQYGFFPEEKTVFEKTCLHDIADFCIQLNKKQRQKRIQRK